MLINTIIVVKASLLIVSGFCVGRVYEILSNNNSDNNEKNIIN